MRSLFQSSQISSARWFSRLTTSALATSWLCVNRHSQQVVGLSSTGWISNLKKSSSIRQTTTSLAMTSLSARTPVEREMHHHALKIVKKGIQAVDPSDAVRSHFRLEDNQTLKIGSSDQIDISKYEKVVLVAFGKASSAMATTVLKQLSDCPIESTGIVICKDDHGTSDELEFLADRGVEVRMASHPVPDERSLSGAAALMDLVRENRSESTLVICCISGGGSALFCKPTPPLSLMDLQAVNSVLLASGMGIQEMNIIRKRLEEGKGGKLAAECHPSQVVTLILSDVLGDPLDLIASGPTVPDESTWVDAWQIIQQYELEERLPSLVIDLLKDGLAEKIPDSPAQDNPAFKSARTVLVGNNALAVQAAAMEAQALGYTPIILGTQIEGEAKEIPNVYTAMALQLQEETSLFSMSSKLPVALIAGGETTVSMPSNCQGKGGRNQELALSAGLLLEKLDLRNVVLASVGTDGTDGPTDAAGAVVDAITARHDIEGARTALATHNAYPFFDRLSQDDAKTEEIPASLVKTGPTGTNVADICVTLVGRAPDKPIQLHD